MSQSKLYMVFVGGPSYSRYWYAQEVSQTGELGNTIPGTRSTSKLGAYRKAENAGYRHHKGRGHAFLLKELNER